jgi:hypothetical protein
MLFEQPFFYMIRLSRIDSSSIIRCAQYQKIRKSVLAQRAYPMRAPGLGGWKGASLLRSGRGSFLRAKRLGM